MTKTKIGQPVSGVVFAGRGEREQAAPRTRDRYQRRIENCYSENKQRSEPTGDVVGLIKPELESKRGHEESQEHRAAVTHENLRRFEVPTKETCRGTEDSSRERGDQSLSIQVSKEGEENGGDGGYTGAQAIHVVENAEGGGNANNKKNSQECIENVAGSPGQNNFKNLCMNPGEQQNTGGQRHAKKQLDLMVQQTAVIEYA